MVLFQKRHAEQTRAIRTVLILMREPLIRVKTFEARAWSHFSTSLLRLLLPAIMAVIVGCSLLTNYCRAEANTNTLRG